MSLSRSGWVLKYLPHTSFLFCTQNCSNLQSNLLCGIWVLYVLQDSTIMAMYLSHKLQLRIRPHPITYPSTGRVYRFIALFIRFSHTLGKTAIHIFYCHLDFCTISVICRLAIYTRLVCAQFHIYCGSVFSVETRNWRNKAFSRSRVYVLWSTLNWGVTGHLAARHLFSLKWFTKLSFFLGFSRIFVSCLGFSRTS